MAISVAQARQICTKAELELVLKSTTRQIGTLDAKQLRASVRRARTLRDKWRDLANAQTRDTKVEDPGNLDRANARSAEKAQLFDEALGRFEKRLAKVDSSTNGAAKTGENPPKKVRASGHRASRAEVRSTLNEKTDTINAATPKPKTTSRAANKSSASTAKSTEPADQPAKKSASRKVVSKKGGTKKAAPKRKAAPKTARPVTSTATNPPTHGLAAAAMAAGRDGGQGGGDKPTGAEKKRNLKAKTAAKATAVSRSGAPRIQGHVSSQGRRNQAKRSAR